MRFEKKYRLEHSSLDEVAYYVDTNALSFQKAYKDRQVNSIYYDTVDFSAYNANLIGISNREKFRVRWYGALDLVSQPVLEQKIKHNMFGSKVIQKIAPFEFNGTWPDLSEITHQYLIPTVIVQYDRSYYESFDQKIRVTIDRNLTYHCIYNGKENDHCTDEAIIIEVKYAPENECMANTFMQSIPYRMCKNSKYVHAMENFLKK